ncbi:MAG: substrate-binding domain-containing protein [Azospirillaceae bacterium]
MPVNQKGPFRRPVAAAGKALAALALVATALPSPEAAAREAVRAVGSTTVLPFSSLIVERFVRETGYPSPVLEGTGSGGGFKLFCEGIGAAYPDLTGASRTMKESEYEACLANGVDDVTLIELGFDGIVFASAIETGPIPLTYETIYLALARTVPVDGELVANPYERWSEIDPDLPDADIMVIGPPPSSSARDFLADTVMEAGCQGFAPVDALAESDPERHETVCKALREDGPFVEAGENDNVILQRLTSTPYAIGIFGFVYLEENRNAVIGNPINGVEPTYDNIVEGDYPLRRTLRVYVKNRHRAAIPGMDTLLEYYVAEAAIGPDGYLVDHGLIVMPEERRREMRRRIEDGAAWQPDF